MIATIRLTHPTEGYGATIRYRKVDGRVTILSVSDSAGKDVSLQMPIGVMQYFKAEILKR